MGCGIYIIPAWARMRGARPCKVGRLPANGDIAPRGDRGERRAILPDPLFLSGAWAELTGGAAKVYAVLALHAGPSGWAWPSLTTIAEMTGMHRQTIPKLARELEAAGLIERDRSRGGRSTRYQLVGHREVPSLAGQSRIGDRSASRSGSEAATETVAQRRVDSSAGARRQSRQRAPNIIMNNKENNDDHEGRGSPSSHDDDDDLQREIPDGADHAKLKAALTARGVHGGRAHKMAMRITPAMLRGVIQQAGEHIARADRPGAYLAGLLEDAIEREKATRREASRHATEQVQSAYAQAEASIDTMTDAELARAIEASDAPPNTTPEQARQFRVIRAMVTKAVARGAVTPREQPGEMAHAD